MLGRSKLMLATRLFRGGGFAIAVLLVVLLTAASASAGAAKTTHRAAPRRAVHSQAAKNHKRAKKHTTPKRGKRNAANAFNQPKVLARGDHYATLSDQVLTVSAANGVLANDTDLAKRTLQVDRVNKTGLPTPIHVTTIDGAAVTMNANGSFTYDATGVTRLDMLPLGDLAFDYFTYRATDNAGGNATATVLVILVGTFVPVQIDNVESSTLDYDAGTPAVAVSSNLTIAAPSDPNLVGATVKIASSEFVPAQDHLNFVNQNGITGSWNSSTGVLTLSGTASVADYQAALRSVTYSDPNGTNPTTGDRKISFQANDGRPSNNLSNVAARTIDVEPNPVPTAGPVSATIGKHGSVTMAVLGSAKDTDGDTLTLAGVGTTGTKGKVRVNPDGSVTYDPNGQFESLNEGQTGTDTFTYTVSDGFHDSTAGTVTITINGSNDAPVLSGIEGGALSYDAGTSPAAVSSLLTVSDPDDSTLQGATVTLGGSDFTNSEDALSFTKQNGISGSWDSTTGVLTLSGSASVANYQAALRSVTFSDSNGASPTLGDRTVTFVVNDGHTSNNFSNSVARTVTVDPNPVPTASAVAASTDKHTPVTITVLKGAKDTDGDTLTLASIDTTGTLGKVSANPDGTVTYDPNGQFESLNEGQTGTDTFTYTVSDGFHDSTAGTVTVTIGGSNDAPVVSNVETGSGLIYDAGTAPVAVTSTLTLSDPDDSTLQGATVTIGGMDATPSEDVLGFTDHNGIDGSFVQKTGVLTLSGSASIADYQEALRSVTFSDANGASPATGPRSISFQVSDGHVSNSLSNSEARTVTVDPNPIPTAGAVSATVNYAKATDIDVLQGAKDLDGDTLSVDSVDGTGTKGTIKINSDGTVHYDPNGQFDNIPYGQTATDTFTYTVSDGYQDSAPGTVTVTIDGPTTPPPALANIESTGFDYDAGTSAVPVTSTLTISSPDSYPTLTGATITIDPSEFTAGEDVLGFVNQANITGSYDSADGVLTLSGSDTLADYQAALRSVTYADTNGTNPSLGARSISFQVDNGRPEGNLSNTVARTVTVDANPVPTASAVSATTNNLKATDIKVLAGAGDTDGDTVTLASVDGTNTKGTIKINSDGTVHYDPNGQFNDLAYGQTATDTFTYTVSDGYHDSTPGTVTVTITGPPTPPPALADIESGKLAYFAGTSPVAVTSSLTVSSSADTMLAGATVTIEKPGFTSGEDVLTFVNQNNISGSYDATTGVLTLSGSDTLANYQAALQSVEYSDTNGKSPSLGDRVIDFQVDNGRAEGNLSNVESRTVTVNANEAPTAGPVAATTDYQTAIDIPVLLKAGDTDGDTVHVDSVDGTNTKGTIKINSDGTVHYDPNGQFNGLQYGQTASDTFTYTVSDGYQDSTPGTVTVTINGPSTAAPVLSGVEASTLELDAGTKPVAVSPGLTITAPDGFANLTGATVSIGTPTEFTSTEDVLGFVNQHNITGSYDPSTGVLTLSGTDSVANYQAALESVTYADTNGTSPSTGSRSISFHVDDGRAINHSSNTVSRALTVDANPVPTANSVTAATDYRTPIDINVLGSAGDTDGDKLSVDAVGTSGTTAAVSINPDGTIHYNPQGKFESMTPGTSTTDTFTYTVSDGYHDSTPATVTVTVTRPQAPVLSSLETTALSYRAQDPGVPITSTIAIADKGSADISGATVSITSGFDSGADLLSFTTQNGISASSYTGGVLTLTGTASLADYAAALQSVVFSTSDAATSPATRTISFVVTDANNASSDPDTRDIDVSEANQAPNAIPHSYTAVGNTPLAVGTSPSGPVASNSGSLLNGDSDTDSTDSVTVSGNTNPSHGSVTVDTDGTFTYTPAAGYTGTDTFTYTIVDSNDASNPKTATATVTITVSNLVWYVDNSQTATGNGEAGSPFNTLAAGVSAAGAGSTLFVYQGNTAYTGGVAMQASENLYGQPMGLTVDGYSLVAAGGSAPVITNTSGNGITLAGGDDVEGVKVSSPSGDGIRATGVGSATVGSVAAVAISGAGGDGIDVSGVASGALDFGTTSVTGSSGHSVSISGRSGGTTTLGGTISDTGTGVSLSSNTGATINFTGKLTASTGTNTAFAATGGGTVAVTATTGNTLATTTGTALNVNGTTIGSSGLNFQSISAGTLSGGPARGIELVNTGSAGGLSVTGGGNTSFGGDASGGTIQKTTSTGSATFKSSDGGVYLSGTADVSLADMNFSNNAANGVYGTNVVGLDLSSDTFASNGTTAANDDTGLRVDGLTGSSTITEVNIEGSKTDNARLFGGGVGTSLTLKVTDSTFSGSHTPGSGKDLKSCATASTDQGAGLLVNAEDGDATVTATGDTFSGNFTNGLEVNSGDSTSGAALSLTATGNSVTDNCNAGILFADGSGGTQSGSFTITNNTVDHMQGDGIAITNLGGGVWHGTISGNTIGSLSAQGSQPAAGSGSLAGSGIAVDDEDPNFTTGKVIAAVTDNNVYEVGSADGANGGIAGTAEGGSPNLQLTVTDNTINLPQTSSPDAMTVQAGDNPSDTSVVCVNATGNTASTSGTAAGNLSYDSAGLTLINNTVSNTFEIQGYTGAAKSTAAVQSYMTSAALNNTFSGPAGAVYAQYNTSSSTSNGFTNGTCATP